MAFPMLQGLGADMGKGRAPAVAETAPPPEDPGDETSSCNYPGPLLLQNPAVPAILRAVGLPPTAFVMQAATR